MSICARSLAKNLVAKPNLLVSSQRFVYHGGRPENALEVNKEAAAKRLAQLKASKISVTNPDLLSKVSLVPEELIHSRRARIFKPAKNAMQSGTNDTKLWRLDFESRERWENPLMGWTSTGDPLSNLHLNFSTKEDAIEYCERYGITFEVDEPQERRNLRKSYSEKFSWANRTRVGSK